MISSINVHCQGESHKDSDKPCQDYSYSSVDEAMAIAVVCDGHGGDRYFRSQVGSQVATEVIVEVVRDFVNNTDPKLFRQQPYTSEGVVTGNEKKLSAIDVKFRQMFSSIITLWNERIDQHAHETPLDEWELNHVPVKYLDEFRENLNLSAQTSTLNKQYGCTLMAYVQMKNYWFAFHLGDGKCISFHKETNFHGEQQIWDEPIPWDDRCFLNKTTSICDSDAINEFRYCYGGENTFPVAVFLGSDGIDDTYGEMENIANFYVEIMKIIARDGVNAAIQQLKDDLPIISRIGSKDDASVAVIFNTVGVKTYIGNFIKFQIGYMSQQADEQAERIQNLESKKNTLEHRISLFDSDRKKAAIELDYACKDLVKASDRLEILSGKISFLSKEHLSLTGESVDNLVDYSQIIEQAKESVRPNESASAEEITEPSPPQPDDEPVAIDADVVADSDDSEIMDNEETNTAEAN